MTTINTLLPTSLVGSYAQPNWLLDRAKLAGRFPPRTRAKELWRVDEAFLEEAQNDATLLAIRDQERAGLDIITDGENGCLYEPGGEDGGAASLIEATKRLLGNDVERQALRKAARNEAERWGWAGATEQLRGYYRQVLDQPQLSAA